jgi:hypothetical protein
VVDNWVKNFTHGRLKVTDGESGAEVAETTVKNVYAAGFDALVK